MNQESPRTPREEMETWLSALLLGELSAAEAAAVRELIKHDAEMAKLHNRLQAAMALVREVESKTVPQPASESLRLSPDRRQRLMASFKIPPLKPEHRVPRPSSMRRLTEILAVIAILALVAAMFLPALSKAKSRSSSVAVRNNLRQLELAKQLWADDNKKSAGDAPTMQELKPYLGSHELPAVVGEQYSAGRVGELAFAEMDASKAKGVVRLPKAEAASDRVRITADGLVTAAMNSGDEAGSARRARGAAFADAGNISGQLGVSPTGDSPASGDPANMREPIEMVPLRLQYPAPTLKGTPEDFSVQYRKRDGDSVRSPAAPPIAGGVPQDSRVNQPAADVVVASPSAVANKIVLPESRTTLNSGQNNSDTKSALADQTGAAAGQWSTQPPDQEQALNWSFGDSFANRSAQAGSSFGFFDTKDLASKPGVPQSAGKPDRNGDATRYYRVAPGIGGQGGRGSSGITDPGLGGSLNGSTTSRSDEAPGVLFANRTEVPQVAVPAETGKEQLEMFSRRFGLARTEGKSSAITNSMSQTSEPFFLGGPAGGVYSQNVVGYVSNMVAVDRLGQLPGLSKQDAINANITVLERDLAEAQKLRTALNMKLATEGVDMNPPQGSVVEIVDLAVPAKKTSGTFGGLLGGSYESSARVKIEHEATDISGLANAVSSSGSYDPDFIQTEVDAIRSEAVLQEVVDKLNLKQEWAKKLNEGRELTTKEATEILRGQLQAAPIQNTALTEIKVASSDAEEAAKLANGIASAYQEHRLEQRRQLALGGIHAIEKSLENQDKVVQQRQAELDALKQKSLAGEPEMLLRKPATNAPIPQPEVPTRENCFSTFSLNVSDVSFKLAMASLERGQMPDVGSVRSEEFLNALDYHDPEPSGGSPIAFAWERARYPFAHNRDLLRFSLKTAAQGRQAGRPLNMVLLLDNSGSMERADRVRIIQEALRVLAGLLQPQDKLSVITFARTARLVADGVSGAKAREVISQVNGLTPQGGTNLEEAMKLAYQTAQRHYLAGGLNRVVVLTDGAANLGDVAPESLKQMVERHRQQGIALDCFGIGWEGFNDDLLEVLSRNGDGRYGFINSPEEAATEFAGQLAGALQVAASDVKVQVEFNSRRVSAFRQLGYAKHQLTKEQFRDNTVDAAEIGAREAGNALYTVEVDPAGVGPLATLRVRYKIPGTVDYREQAWDVPYSGTALGLEQSSPAMRLAATASAFAEWLVVSPFAGEVTPDRLLGLMRGVPEAFGADARPKQLEWMIRQAKSVQGK